MTTAVPPLSGGTGEHGSEATHAFTIADSVGGVGGWSASRTGRVLALGQMFWTACRQAAWMDKAELSWLMGTPAECSAGGVRSVARLPDFPEVRIRAERLDIREFGPADASLVSEVLEGGEWLPLSTALVGASDSEYPADVDWWLADAVHEPRRDRTGLNLMMLAREDDRIAGWIYLTDVDTYACSAQIGYGVRPHARGRGFATEALVAVSRWALMTGGLQRAWLSVNTDNSASLRVARKAGFTLEGILRRASLEDDGLHDVAVLSLLDDEILRDTR